MAAKRRRYAEGTTVPAEKSIAEIERLIDRFGCDNFGMMWANAADGTREHTIVFQYKRRNVKLAVRVPSDDALRRDQGGYWIGGTDEQVARRREAELRRRWRVQVLLIKAKVEAIEDEATSFDAEFAPLFVLPDGRTVAEWVGEEYDRLAAGQMPPLLTAGGGR